jgi:hypothetical protein
METIKVIAGIGTPLKGKLMVCDFNDMYFTNIEITKRANCSACHSELGSPRVQEKLIWICGQDTANINSEKPLSLNLANVCKNLEALRFDVRLRSQLALIFGFKGYEVSLFTNGRMLIKNVRNEKEALEAYKDVEKTLKLR